MGVELQVLKRGTLFGPRAKKLYELYMKHDSIDLVNDLYKPLFSNYNGNP